MGIPGLYSQLHKYGSTTVLHHQASTSKSPRTAAIIDGPALAHSIARQILPQSTSASLDPQPDYEAIGKATIRWLDRLRSYNFEIEGVYFDGALPAYKRGTRLDRLQGYVNRLVDYRALHNQASRSNSRTRAQAERTTRILETAKNGLPPPPFVVFAVVEALLASEKYAVRTYLVPGEADAFCAAAAETSLIEGTSESCVIFTSDSDLVLYDFQSPVRVAMISDMRESGNGEESWLEIFEFEKGVLDGRFEAQGVELLNCAFTMVQQRCTLADAVGQQMNVDVGSTDYAAFKSLYSVENWVAQLGEIKVRKPLCFLDSRISEPIYQEGTGELDLFLPVLLDDPTRTTAWRIGSEFREMAAQMLLLQKNATSIREHKRSGTQVRANTIVTAEASSLDSRFQELADSIPAYGDSSNSSVPRAVWYRVAIMAMVLQELFSTGVAFPPYDDIITVLSVSDLTTWTSVYLSAQFQAEFYSLRILGQIASGCENSSAGLRNPESQQNQAILFAKAMPGIASLFSVPLEWRGKETRQRWALLLQGFSEEISSLLSSECVSEDVDAIDLEEETEAFEVHAAFGDNPFAVLGAT